MSAIPPVSFSNPTPIHPLGENQNQTVQCCTSLNPPNSVMRNTSPCSNGTPIAYEEPSSESRPSLSSQPSETTRKDFRFEPALIRYNYRVYSLIQNLDIHLSDKINALQMELEYGKSVLKDYSSNAMDTSLIKYNCFLCSKNISLLDKTHPLGNEQSQWIHELSQLVFESFFIHNLDQDIESFLVTQIKNEGSGSESILKFIQNYERVKTHSSNLIL